MPFIILIQRNQQFRQNRWIHYPYYPTLKQLKPDIFVQLREGYQWHNPMSQQNIGQRPS